MTEYVNPLLAFENGADIRKQPIIFVAHSLGGIVVKRVRGCTSF